MAKMEFTSLGSGSRGNGTVIRGGDTALLIDCGFSRSNLEYRLSRRSLTIDQIDAVLVTHEHGDHRKGVLSLARRHEIPVYASRGTLDVIRERERGVDKIEDLLFEIVPGVPFQVKDLIVYPIAVPHDVVEPTQFVCRFKATGIGVLTDCGSYTEQMIEHYAGLNGLLLETNHDSHMLETGPYPSFLKARVGGRFGHLNNRQSREFAERIMHSNLQHLVLGHISEQNNDQALIEREFSDLQSNTAISFASQDYGTEWLSVNSSSNLN